MTDKSDLTADDNSPATCLIALVAALFCAVVWVAIIWAAVRYL